MTRRETKTAAEATAPAPLKLYKVLVDGRSCHGGKMLWSLPTKGADGSWTPGEWHEVDGPAVIGRSGLHLTDSPQHWWLDGATAYEVEAEGVVGDPDAVPDRKVAARRVRLLRPVDPSGFLDAAETARLREEIRTVKERAVREAEKIVHEAHNEARGVFAEAFNRREENRRRKERAEVARVASLTPAQRKKERAAGKVDCSAVSQMATIAYANSDRSSRRTTDAVWAVLALARDNGVRFELGDIADAVGRVGVDIGYDALEGFYAKAVEARNDSACASVEHYFGRKPWIWQGVRLARGSELQWEGQEVEVTSFKDSGEGSFIACAYKRERVEGTSADGSKWFDRTKTLTRRFTITREAFVAARKALKSSGGKAAA